MRKNKIVVNFITDERPKNIQINDLATFFCDEKKCL